MAKKLPDGWEFVTEQVVREIVRTVLNNRSDVFAPGIENEAVDRFANAAMSKSAFCENMINLFQEFLLVEHRMLADFAASETLQ